MLFWSNPIVTSDVYQLLFPVVPDVTFKLQDGAVLSMFIVFLQTAVFPASSFTYPYIVVFPSLLSVNEVEELYDTVLVVDKP